MARIRTVKPEFWSDSTIAELDFFTRLFYIALWNFADDEGRNRAIAKELSGFAFPLDDDVDNAMIERSLASLADKGRVILYTVRGVRHYQIVHWQAHQVINHKTNSKIPPPDGYAEALPETSGNTPVAQPEPSSEISGRKWKAEGDVEVGIRKAEAEAERECEGKPQQQASAPVSAPPAPLSRINANSAPLAPALLTRFELKDLLASGPPNGPCWTHAEIDVGVAILAERKKPPGDAKALLHSKILPEVREGRGPPVPEKPPPKVSRPKAETAADAALNERVEATKRQAAERARQREETVAKNGNRENAGNAGETMATAPACPP